MSYEEEATNNKGPEAHFWSRLAKMLVFAGVFLVGFSVVLFLLIFYPVLKEEIRYKVSDKPTDVVISMDDGEHKKGEDHMNPVDTDFGIVVPKINANAKVIENVDPYNSWEYQQSLTQGVAHAKGSSVPGEDGNVFIFAHSSDNFYNANRYNSVFYLLNKLEISDYFYLIKDSVIYKYAVEQTGVVKPENVEYLSPNYGERTAVLMTCWPPGTTIDRLIVVGKLDSITK